MSAVATHPYIAALLAGSSDLPKSPLAWLNERRGAALERANALSVPTTRDEEWRFTDITPLTRLLFQPVAELPQLAAADIENHYVPEAAVRLVFVDGVYATALSEFSALPAGVRVSALSAALESDGTRLAPHLARHAGFEQNVFTALNTAHLREGALLVLEKNAQLAAPVHVLHVATRKDAVAYPRCLVVTNEGSECALIEDYVALTADAYFCNAVTEIVVGPNAAVRHVRLQRESTAAFHIGTCAVNLARDARYFSHAVTFGARISRHDLNITQNGEGAQVKIDGLALISGRQLADTHTTMDHAQPDGRCEQLHKCIVDGGAHVVFNGKVLVREGAQLTDSSQQSRNLLLSGKARVDTKPQLEIFADDVKCAHGATVGQLDADHLFYLKSRGLSDTSARNLLTYAFGAEVIARIPVRSVANRLERAVMAQTQVNL
jgi:Fe-S cluster assembly protein SufD